MSLLCLATNSNLVSDKCALRGALKLVVVIILGIDTLDCHSLIGATALKVIFDKLFDNCGLDSLVYIAHASSYRVRL